MNRFLRKICLFILIGLGTFQASASHSPARVWNEVLLECIRLDFARPTVHARNLYHHSLAMYDIWSVLDGRSETYFLGKTVGNYSSEFNGLNYHGDKEYGASVAFAYASNKLLKYRFRNAPGVVEINHLQVRTILEGILLRLEIS